MSIKCCLFYQSKATNIKVLPIPLVDKSNSKQTLILKSKSKLLLLLSSLIILRITITILLSLFIIIIILIIIIKILILQQNLSSVLVIGVMFTHETYVFLNDNNKKCNRFKEMWPKHKCNS